MKSVTSTEWIVFAAFGLAMLFLPSRVTAQGSGAEVLTNDSVVQMVAGKVPKDLILAKIQSTSSAFDTTANALVSLFKSKVPTDAIKIMMQASSGKGSKEVLSNDAVVYMVTNQLPRDLILAKIQSTKAGYDLTASGLVSLNQNKVPQNLVKAMMAATAAPPASSTASPPQTSAPPSAGTSGKTAAGGGTDRKPAAPAPLAPAKLKDGEAALLHTALSQSAATTKVKTYFGKKKVDYAVTPGRILSDWYGDRRCGTGIQRCANRASVRLATEQGKTVIRVQVMERTREGEKPWRENGTSKAKETAQLAAELEAVLQ